MEKQLLIEAGSHSTDLMLYSNEKTINFKEYEEELCSTFSEINLYLVEEDYYETYLSDYEETKKELVAKIYGRYFDIIYARNHRISLYDVFDMPDADSATLIPFLLDEDGEIKDEYFSVYDNIYYLDRLEVQEQYQGKGYAKFLLNNLVEILMYLSKLNVGIIIIQAQPYDIINGESTMVYNDKKRTERLIKLYENCGFTRIDKTNYLILVNE